MKHFGVITYHHYENYGTVLQALALQQAILAQGYPCELIDYKEDSPLSRKELLKLRLRRFPVYLCQWKKYLALWNARASFSRRSARFEKFYQTHLRVGSRAYRSAAELMADPPVYDGYIVGSDQTWNPLASHRPAGFFLPFVEDNGKKGSYAPSIGISHCNQEQITFFRTYLQQFACLSCREKVGAELLSAALDRPVETVLDPTLLLDTQMWAHFAAPVENLPTQYILVYFLGDQAAHRKTVAHLQKQLNLPVISIPVSYRELRDRTSRQEYVGPDQFLWLIQHASLVCTDSYHGTAFAINYQRDFYTFSKFQESDPQSENSRVHHILSLLHLENRLLPDGALPTASSIAYDAVNSILTKEREHSTAYLRAMLDSLGE